MTTNELLERALFYSYRSQWDRALEYAQRAVDGAPDNFLAYKRLSLALWNSGRKEEAIETLKKSVELNPEFASAYYNLACYYAQMNNKTEMLVHLKKAIALDEYTDYQEMAEEDEDFEGFWGDDDFLEIVESAKQENKRLSEIFAGEDYDLINKTLLKIDNEIPLKAVVWSSYDSENSISGLLESKADKIEVEALRYLFNISTMNSSVEGFDGFSILLETLRAKLKEAFDDILVQAWKSRYEYTDPGHLESIDYQMLEAIQQLPVEKAAELTLWGLKSHGKDALGDYENLNALLLEKLPEPHPSRTALVEIIDHYLHGDIYKNEAFEVRQRRIKIAIAPPPLEFDSNSGDKWAREKAALAHSHPAHVINAADRLSIQNDPAIVDLVRQKIPEICQLIFDFNIPVDLRITAVTDVVVRLGNKASVEALGPALHDKSAMFLEALGRAMHQYGVVPEENRIAVDYLIEGSNKAEIDIWELYHLICALRWFKDERIASVLLAALGKGNEAVRREALIGLGIQKATSAIPQIVEQLYKGSPQCVTAAAKSLDAIGGVALEELKSTANYKKVLDAAQSNPRWSTEALLYFQVEGIIDDLIRLFRTNEEFEATPHLADGIAMRGSESNIPQLVQLGLDRYRANYIGGRHFVEIFRSIARRSGTPSQGNILNELKEIISTSNKEDLADFMNSMKNDAKYASISAPTEAEKEAEEMFTKVYSQELKAVANEATQLAEVMFSGAPD